MALEDYKISNDTIMCWDSDGRLNTNIWPGNLKVNKVSTILPQLDNFALIKGLVLDGDSFKQYSKVEGSLYLMCDEIKRMRLKAKRSQVASPILTQLKKYIKEEGFVWDPSGGIYIAPTDKFSQNQHSYINDGEETSYYRGSSLEECWIEIYPSEKKFLLHWYQRAVDLAQNDSSFKLSVCLEPWVNGELDEKVYDGFTEENLEQFKKDWIDYKNHLIGRLESFKKEVEDKKSLFNTSYTNISKQLSTLGYTQADRSYNYIGGTEYWYKLKKLDDNLYLRGIISFSKTFSEVNNYQLKYDSSFVLYQGRDEIWRSNANYWSYKTNERNIPKGLTPAILNSILEEHNGINSIEEANKFINKGFEAYEDAFSDDEIGFNGQESLSLTEAFSKLREE